MDLFPPFPEVPAAQCATGPVPVRYEDVSQEGRVKLIGIPHVLGEVVWKNLMRGHAIADLLRHQGVVPILSRIVIAGGGGPVPVPRPWQGRGCYQLAHTAGDDGQPDRILLNLFGELEGKRGRTHGPPPPGAGEPVVVGRVFAEHVFTRPFGPPEQRKVVRLDAEGLPPVPPDRVEWRAAPTLIEAPSDVTFHDDALEPDVVPIRFGLADTDSNQHVNSLVYPRMFEEAVLRRLAARGKSTLVLARFAELGYRKPCFAGDAVRILLRTWEDKDGRIGACGAFVPEGGDVDRAHAYARMVLEP